MAKNLQPFQKRKLRYTALSSKKSIQPYNDIDFSLAACYFLIVILSNTQVGVTKNA
jgi:hypothetical protein